MKTKPLLFTLILFSLFFFHCSKKDSVKLSSENKIISFSIDVNDTIYIGNIDHDLNVITLKTYGLEVYDSLVPKIEISPKSIITPNDSIGQNFNNGVVYTITAENGDIASYSVVLENTPLSSEKKILSFSFEIENVIFDGIINHDSLTVIINTYKLIPEYIVPNVSISDKAIIAPSDNDQQNFNRHIKYTIIAEDGSISEYTVKTRRTYLYVSSLRKKFYSNAKNSGGTIHNLDLSEPNIKFYLEDNLNSYEIDYSELNSYYNTLNNENVKVTNFRYDIPENINTSANYIMSFRRGDTILAESTFKIDIISENLPIIDSTDKDLYRYKDTVFIYGKNLVPGLGIPRPEALYVFDEGYKLQINPERTILKLALTFYVYSMYNIGPHSPGPVTRTIRIYHNGRSGDSIDVQFTN